MPERADIQRQVDRGVAWIGLASLLVGLLDLVSNLICLRLWVSAADFGAATLATALFPVLDRIGGLGLSQAAIHRAGGPRSGLDSIFWLGLGHALLVLTGLLAAAPVIADFFPHPLVAGLLCAYGGKLVFQNVYIVPESILKHELRYRELSMIRIAAMLADSVAKLGSAYLGAHGHPELQIWCFVIGPLANAAVTGIGVQICRPWRPRLAFRLREAIDAARFGISLAAAEGLYFLYTSADYLVVGRFFGDAAVGAYRLAYELVIDVVRLVSLVTAEIAFPTFSRLRADRAALPAQFVRFTRQNLIALAPVLVFVAVAADDLLAILYPPLGPDAALVARILCAVGALRTLSFVVPPMLAGIGQTSVALIYNAVAAVLLPAAFIIGAEVAPSLGYVSVGLAWAIGYPIAFAALLALALPRIGLSVGAYLRGIAGILAITAVTLAVGALARWPLPPIALLRAAAVAVAVAAVYLLLMARFERVTPRAVWRSLRGEASGGGVSPDGGEDR